MARKAIIRAFVILALIVTAHLIRPFSIKNVTQHLLYSTRSFRFVLPPQLREKFDHANYLAINLSNGLFEADEGIRDFTWDMTADLEFGPINVQPLDEVNKSATKQKSCPKKSAPAKRPNRTQKRSAHDPPIMSGLVAIARSNEFSLVEMPSAYAIEATVDSFVQPCLTKLFPARITTPAPFHSIEAVLKLRKRDCEKREAIQKARIALIENETGAKGSIWVVQKPGIRKIALSVSECKDQETEATAEEAEAEMMRADPVAPRAAEESRTPPFSAPFAKCSKEP